MVFAKFYPSVNSELDMLDHTRSEPAPLPRPAKPPRLYHPECDPSLLQLEERHGIKPRYEHVETTEGHVLLTTVFKPLGKIRGRIIGSQGKGETAKCWPRLATSLALRGFDTRVVTPAGQGASTRFMPFPYTQRIHDPNEFRSHRRNLIEVIEKTEEHDGKPTIVVSHSMGSAFVLPKHDEFPIDGHVALAPLVEAIRAPLKGFRATHYRAYARFMTRLGFGEYYVPRGTDYVETDIGPNNLYTDYLPDLVYAKQDWKKGSILVTNDVTVGWLNSYYKNADRIMALAPQSDDMPIKIILAKRDAFVVNATTRKAAEAFRNCDISEVDAKHALPLGGPEITDYIVDCVEKLCETVTVRPKRAPREAVLN